MVDWVRVFLLVAVPLATVGSGMARGADIRLVSRGKTVFEGACRGGASGNVSIKTEKEAAHDVFLGYPHGPKTSEFVPKGAERETNVATVSGGDLVGTVFASKDSMACDARADATLGSSFGEATDGNFNAVYDRAADWLIVFEAPSVRIRPTKGGYSVETTGALTVRLKVDYVKNHLGYFLWKPEHALWSKPVAGWCSWMAHLQDVKEEDMLGAARFFSENLRDYGFDVVQMDDGFQRTPQSGDVPLKPGEKFSECWTKPNAKFPHGLSYLAHQIQGLGMTPGIWVGFYLPLGLQNADGYVTDPDGKPHKGPWVNYAVNGEMPKAVDEAYGESIRVLRQQGWKYFKIDTLRHVLYDNYRKTPQYWASRGESMEAAYRKIYEAVKKETGNGIYALACWGALPELAGIPDGCRIGEDVGPDVASMRRSAKYIAQFQHLNNVVWRNDPDYMCLRVPVPQAQTWASLTALAGGHIMVSDPIQDYDPARVEILRKVGPPMMLKPINVNQLKPDPFFIKLAAEKDGEHWTVVTRFGWGSKPAEQYTTEALGLDSRQHGYLAFDFWTSRFLGVIHGNVAFHALEDGESQTVSFRPLAGHPQVLGTDRHIGQGVYELSGVKWDGSSLSGAMQRGKGARWSLFLYVPTGWAATELPSGAEVSHPQEHVVQIKFAEGSSAVRWKVGFRTTK